MSSPVAVALGVIACVLIVAIVARYLRAFVVLAGAYLGVQLLMPWISRALHTVGQALLAVLVAGCALAALMGLFILYRLGRAVWAWLHGPGGGGQPLPKPVPEISLAPVRPPGRPTSNVVVPFRRPERRRRAV